MENFIEIKNLIFDYTDEEGKLISRALDGVSLDIAHGEFVAIIGSNGSGKSTLVKMINALLQPTEGDVLVDGLNTKDEENLLSIRQKSAMVFQNPDNQIISAVVEDDVAFGPENLGIEPAEIRKRVDAALAAVSMSAYSKKAPHMLSGGQKQRIAIAGALAMKPNCILFDEPTAMLDPIGRKEVMDIIGELHAEGITCVLVTHFMEEAITADRVFVMHNGRIALEGTPERIFSQPKELMRLNLEPPVYAQLVSAIRDRIITGFSDGEISTKTADKYARAFANIESEEELINRICQFK